MSISISAAFNRTSGIGPLHVYCDATGTTSTATTRPFHEIRYIWEAVSHTPDAYSSAADLTAQYTTGAKDQCKYLAYGPVAGFLLEESGTWVIRLTVWDGADYATSTQSITVYAQEDQTNGFTWANTYFCSSGTIDNAELPSGAIAGGATKIENTDWSALQTSAFTANNKRILLKRGDVFTATTTFLPSNSITGNIVFGAWGSGARPIVRLNPASSISGLVTSNSGVATARDKFTVQDIEFDGGWNSTGAGAAIAIGGNYTNITILRVKSTNHNLGVVSSLNAVQARKYTGIFECDFTVSYDGQAGIFITEENYTIRGCTINSNSHVVRTNVAYKCCITNNDLIDIGGGTSNVCIKMHSLTWTAGVVATNVFTGGGYSSYNVIANNYVSPNASCASAIDLEPQDSLKDERVDENVVDGNYIFNASNINQGINISGVNNTVRNNLVNFVNATSGIEYGVSIQKRAAAQPAVTGNEIYNNTIYYSGTATGFRGINIATSTSNAIVKNNIAYAPNANSPSVVTDAGTTSTISDNSATAATNPNFSSATPSAFVDFIPTSGSGVAGFAMDNYLDAAGNSRRVHGDSVYIGAFNPKDKGHKFRKLA